jgi:hypothetical protein
MMNITEPRLIFRRFLLLVVITLALGGVSLAEDAVKLKGSEAAAAALAVDAFKKIYAKPDLRHYSVELSRRGKQLEVTFIADSPKTYAPGTAGTGGGSKFGPDMTYVVSLDQLKIISFNFYR